MHQVKPSQTHAHTQNIPPYVSPWEADILIQIYITVPLFRVAKAAATKSATVAVASLLQKAHPSAFTWSCCNAIVKKQPDRKGHISE